MKSVGGGAMYPDKKGENVFLCTGGGIKKSQRKYRRA